MPDLPERFGPYLLERRLALGGMGELFVARRVAPEGANGGVAGRPCVLKRILPDLCGDPEFVRRFQEESALAVRLRHEAILRVIEAGCCDGRHFLVLEHVDGPDLRRLLSACWRAGRVLPPEVAVSIAHRLLGALAYAHDLTDTNLEPLDLIHRDVSPANVLVSRQGDVKLIDFGLAKTRAAAVSTRPNVLFGKVGYLSPEQARGEPLDQRSDLYSVGAILFELLTGERLVNASDSVDLLDMVANPPRPRRVSSLQPGLPRELDRVVARALARDPDRRFDHARELQIALYPFLARPLPELRALTGQVVVELVGPTDRPAVAPEEPRPSLAAIEVEGSREPTARRARRLERPAAPTPPRPLPAARNPPERLATSPPPRVDDEARHRRHARLRLWRRAVLLMLGAAVLLLVLFQALRW